jgi:hypothetical protein
VKQNPYLPYLQTHGGQPAVLRTFRRPASASRSGNRRHPAGEVQLQEADVIKQYLGQGRPQSAPRIRLSEPCNQELRLGRPQSAPKTRVGSPSKMRGCFLQVTGGITSVEAPYEVDVEYTLESPFLSGWVPYLAAIDATALKHRGADIKDCLSTELVPLTRNRCMSRFAFDCVQSARRFRAHQ